MSNPQLTLLNQVPAGFGQLTYTITDGFHHSTALTVPSGGSVLHPIDPNSAPWLIAATLNGNGPTNPGMSTLPLQVTDAATLTVGLNLALATSPPTPTPTPAPAPAPAPASIPSTEAGLAQTTPSLLDPTRRQSLAAPAPMPAAVTAPAPPPPASLKLVFAMQRQTQTNWCWSALACSVSDYYAPSGNPPTYQQCDLANWATTGPKTCCATPSSAACNQPYQPELALAYVKCFNGPLIQGTLLYSDVVKEIVAARPVAVRVTWQGTNGAVGHVLSIVGYDNTDPSDANATIDLKDPTWGESVVTFIGFPQNYHSGVAWTHTFKTQAPPVPA